MINLTQNEQKQCVVYGHLGMGDMYWMNGAVRFLSTIYDEVIVVVKNRNLNNTYFMYSNDQTIKTFPIEKDIPIKDIELKFPEHKIFSCGIHVNKSANNYPHSFYLDMDIDPNIRTEYFNHAISLESKDLYNKIEEKYVLVHDSKSTSKIDFNNILDIDKILTLNINKNMYHKDHKYYKIASEFVDLPLYYYIDTIKNAKELHLIESSLACLAVHLDLQKVKIKKTYQSSNNFINLGIFK